MIKTICDVCLEEIKDDDILWNLTAEKFMRPNYIKLHIHGRCFMGAFRHLFKNEEKEEQELRDKNIKIMEIDMTERN